MNTDIELPALAVLCLQDFSVFKLYCRQPTAPIRLEGALKRSLLGHPFALAMVSVGCPGAGYLESQIKQHSVCWVFGLKLQDLNAGLGQVK